jgi:nucleotidyltransferase/DNA polymerase involved in DNA repair
MHTHTIIGHLNADCFYVSCERVRFASLVGKPVGVLGNQGVCVIAKSFELRATGVKTGVPIWEAHALCPTAIYVKRDFQWYEALSRRMLEITRTVSAAVEYYSIDELFFDASLLPRAFGRPLPDAARALQERIRNELGLQVTIGIAPTKTLAKLVSDTSKPFGCAVVVGADERQRLLASLPVDAITGIARRRSETLSAHRTRRRGHGRRGAAQGVCRTQHRAAHRGIGSKRVLRRADRALPRLHRRAGHLRARRSPGAVRPLRGTLSRRHRAL